MKIQLNLTRAFRATALALGMGALISSAPATPYASCLTNNGTTISFRLNEDAESVKIIYNGGALTNDLGAVPRGLTNVPLAVVGPYKIQVYKTGTGLAGTNAPRTAYNSPRDIDVNRNPASPNFGRVYVANSAAGTKGDGIYIHNADWSEGTAARTAGYNWGTGGASAPYRVSVAPDDTILICDWSDASGNVIITDPNVTTNQYLLKQIGPNQYLTNNAVTPVGSNNVHGSIVHALIAGSGASRVLYTIDEDYQTNPTNAILSELNSAWRYDIGASTFPYSNPPNAKLMTPYLRTISGQNGDAEYATNGYLYIVQRRANAGQYSLYIVDTQNPVDPATYPGAQGGYLWNSQQASADLGWSDDICRDAYGVTVSSDLKYLAIVVAVGGVVNSNPGLGISETNIANDIVIIPMTNGIPDLPKHFTIRPGGAGNGRGIAFDAANNLYWTSSGLAVAQSFTLGLTSFATTTSDGTFALVTPNTEVNVTATIAEANEAGPVNGQFTLTRSTDNPAVPLTVNFTLTGTASNGVDYATLATNVTFGSGVTTVTLNVNVIDDSVTEFTETAILTLAGSGNYSVGTLRSATVNITDNEPTELSLLPAPNGASMYESVTNDYVKLRFSRKGDPTTALYLDASALVASGVAVSNLDYTLTDPATFAPFSVFIDPNTVTKDVAVAWPLNDSLVEGPETFTLALLPGFGYVVGATNAQTFTIVDDEQLPETVLFSENFNDPASSNNWKVVFASLDGVDDKSVEFGYDYSLLGIPPAPLSSSDTLGLRLSVNKLDAILAAAGVNAYPIGKTFSGNYALRFNMYLIMGSGASTTEYAIFGVNHSGNQTNWFRNSGNGFTNSVIDGLWYQVEADGAALGDYVLNTGPLTNNAGLWTPTTAGSANASSFYGTFKTPPWTVGAGSGGVPANQSTTATPIWADVEVSQMGKVVTLKVNNTTIMTTTNKTAYTNGNIMLGYDDAYDSVNSGGAAVIYDNVRVISLNLNVTSFKLVGSNVQIDFTWSLNDPVSAFKLQSSASAGSGYANTASATITQLGLGQYRAVAPVSGAVQFYRIAR